jgi:hypothetical protein
MEPQNKDPKSVRETATHYRVEHDVAVPPLIIRPGLGNQAAIELLESWRIDGDEQEQRETWEFLEKDLEERYTMDTVTLQGPVVVLPEHDYRNLLDRIGRLEKTITQLVHLLEDRDDIRVMREAEVEYQAGDRSALDDLLAEVEAEAKRVSS